MIYNHFISKFATIIFMDQISFIRKPVEKELEAFNVVFDKCFVHDNNLINKILQFIHQKKGKQMRPILVLLTAKLNGEINDKTLYSAVTLELLHTASLVHDDVVDESDRRRGQRSVNSLFDNRLSVLMGDYLLSSALLNSAKTNDCRIVNIISILGQLLAEGEIKQIENIDNKDISEEKYLDVIEKKTAVLFAASAEMGAVSAGASDENIAKIREFGRLLGICFQIKDDIFDYISSSEIGKPTGNDMREGKLTLPAIYAVNKSTDAAYRELAMKVKSLESTEEEREKLMDFAIKNGGIEYAESVMKQYEQKAKDILGSFPKSDIRDSLFEYLDFVTNRNL